MYVCVSKYIYTCLYICLYIYICIYIYVYIYMYVFIYVFINILYNIYICVSYIYARLLNITMDWSSWENIRQTHVFLGHVDLSLNNNLVNLQPIRCGKKRNLWKSPEYICIYKYICILHNIIYIYCISYVYIYILIIYI